MKLAVTLSMGLALLPGMGFAAGGFYNSCKNSWRMEGSRMITECKKINGQYLRSRHDLNLCITNSFGTLKPANLGMFMDSCWGCQQGEGLITADEPPTPYITCMCRNGNGAQEVSASLNLNNFVENRDGYIWCSGHRSEAF